MAEVAPMDEAMLDRGIFIPLPLAPDLEGVYSSFECNDHHSRHRRRDPELSAFNKNIDPIEKWGSIVRASRIERVPILWHNRYHRDFSNSVHPKNIHQRAATLIMDLAGYLPQQIIDTRNRNTRIRKMTETEKLALQSPGIMKVESGYQNLITTFLARYIVEYGLSEVISHKAVDMFLETNDPDEKLRAGFAIVSLAASVVVDPVEPVYQTARATGAIPHNKPASVRRLVLKRPLNPVKTYLQPIHEALLKVA